MSIVFIAPDRTMAEEYRRILSTIPGRIEVVEALLSEAVPLARRLEGQSAEVFVARGGTAMLLRKDGIKAPIVEIQLTSSDIVQALTKAKSRGPFGQPRNRCRRVSQHDSEFVRFPSLPESQLGLPQSFL